MIAGMNGEDSINQERINLFQVGLTRRGVQASMGKIAEHIHQEVQRGGTSRKASSKGGPITRGKVKRISKVG